jgi:hypothetical protein
MILSMPGISFHLAFIMVLMCPFVSGGRADQFASCLPAGVRPAERISPPDGSSEANGAKQTTVQQMLIKLRARCRKGKLIDRTGKEIYFYRLVGCWGNPPEDYLAVLEKQREEIGRLKKKYNVIELSCAQFEDLRRIN